MTLSAPRVSALTITGIALASALVPLNSTMIAVALPRVAREFDVSKGHAAVLITVYLAAMLVGQPIAGRIVDIVGARRMAVIAVSGFGGFSAAAVFAPSFVALVALRVGQAAVDLCRQPADRCGCARRAPQGGAGRWDPRRGSINRGSGR